MSADAWRGGKSAVAVMSFDVDAETAIFTMGRSHAANPMVMSHQSYGPLVGVPRIIEMLGQYDIRATFFVPGFTADRYPGTVERILEAGHEIGHHSYAHHAPLDLDESAERADFERALAALARCGVRPVGYRAANWEPHWRTPELLVEYGMLYDSSLMAQDRPYRIKTSNGDLIELPPHWSLDDSVQYGWLPRPVIGDAVVSPQLTVEMWRGELDAMRRYGSAFILTAHPFLSGRPSRIEVLRALIEHGLGCGDVEFMAAADLARRAAEDPELFTQHWSDPVFPDPELFPEP